MKISVKWYGWIFLGMLCPADIMTTKGFIFSVIWVFAVGAFIEAVRIEK